MSNYTKTVNFAIKDSLSTGDPNKLILGTDIDTEFTNIATAVATKSDSTLAALLASSNTFTGGSQTVNPASGNASVQLKIASTAILQVGVASAAAQLIADSAQNDVAIINQQSGKAIRFSTDNGATTNAIISTALINLKATDVQVNGFTILALQAVKAATTGRNTTTTLADDPDLVIAVPVAGTYEIRALLLLTGTTAAAQGFKYQLVYTGTSGAIGYYTVGSINGAASTPLAAAGAFNVSTHATVLIDGGAGATTDFDYITGTFVASTAGNLKVQWAQSTSTGNNSNLKAGSVLAIRRIA